MIATIDLSVLEKGPSPERAKVLWSFLNAIASHDTVKIIGHDISITRIAWLFQWTKEFFEFPNTVKVSAASSGTGPNRGYMTTGKDNFHHVHYKSNKSMEQMVLEEKEYFTAGSILDVQNPTPWPVGERCNQFRFFIESFLEECLMLHHYLLHILEEALYLKNHELISLCREGNGDIRLTHYPTRSQGQVETKLRDTRDGNVGGGLLKFDFQEPSVSLMAEEHPDSSISVPRKDQNFQDAIVVQCDDLLLRLIRGYIQRQNHAIPFHRAEDRGNESGVVFPQYSVQFTGRADGFTIA